MEYYYWSETELIEALDGVCKHSYSELEAMGMSELVALATEYNI